jgi:hypothetical protein
MVAGAYLRLWAISLDFRNTVSILTRTNFSGKLNIQSVGRAFGRFGPKVSLPIIPIL